MTAAAEKHTPGPWDYEFGHLMQSGIRYWQAHNGQDAICSNQFCYAANGDEAASEANARLIAAAPDLLEALKAMRAVMDSGDKPKKLDAALSWRECDEKARAMCDSAISKAEVQS